MKCLSLPRNIVNVNELLWGGKTVIKCLHILCIVVVQFYLSYIIDIIHVLVTFFINKLTGYHMYCMNMLIIELVQCLKSVFLAAQFL